MINNNLKDTFLHTKKKKKKNLSQRGNFPLKLWIYPLSIEMEVLVDVHGMDYKLSNARILGFLSHIIVGLSWKK